MPHQEYFSGPYAPHAGGVADPSGRVLVMDDQDLRSESINRVLSRCEADVQRMEGVSERSAIPREGCCPLILMALTEEPIPNTPALAFIQTLSQNRCKILAYADHIERWSVRARCLPLLAGASHLLDSAQSGFESELLDLINRILEAEAGREEQDRTVKEIMAAAGVVGESPAMVAVFRTILRISILSDLPTLITGETGTGKERLAQAIHKLDPKRCSGPFVALNCAALNSGVAESALFGPRRGAFTGAERDRKGLIRAAHGGILFLDEIGDLDGLLQAKLLRVLQENRVLGVGYEEEIAVNVRVVAATNRDLKELVEQGKFRADLFHRLNVLSVRLPALRERLTDLAPLVRFFLKKYGSLRPENQLTVAPDFLEGLTQLDLPGNVRQLENLIQQALVKKETNTPLSLSDLPTELLQQLCGQQAAWHGSETQRPVDSQAEPSSTNDLPPESPGRWEELLRLHGGNLARCLRSCEREMLAAVLRRTQGNQSQTARMLGITPRSVYNKVRKYRLQF